MQNASATSQPVHDVMQARDVRIPLRDGVTLGTDLYFPACDQQPVGVPHPVLLIRTPYDRAGSAASGDYFAKRGYVFAAQDVRGRYGSEGEFHAFTDEGPDGYDTIEWLARQPWCNGQVGTFGASYCAAAQSAAACHAPPHLEAMVVRFGPSSYFHSSMRHNGVLELRFLVYAFNMAATSREAAREAGIRKALNEAAINVWDYIKAGPIRRGTTPLALVPDYEQWAIDIQTHATYDDFWKSPGFGPRPHYDAHADVPTLYVGGWYDTYTRGIIENFQELSRRKCRPVRLLMGPWTHGGVGVAESGDTVFRPNGALNYNTVLLRWFDHWLKGLPNGVAEEPPARYFLMGGAAESATVGQTIERGGDWRTAEEWPPEHTTTIPYYLTEEGVLETAPPQAAESATTYTFDPANPVPTLGGNLSAMPLPPGGFDQRYDKRFTDLPGHLPVNARRDVLSFSTPPLETPLAIAGPLRVVLHVSTDAPDTDFTVKLIDLCPPSPGYPAGAAVNLSDSIARLRFRNGFDREVLAQPGQVYELDITLFPTACLIAAGHRIRLDVSSSNYPRFELNPNTGAPLGRDRALRIAQNTVHHDDAHPSRLLLTCLSDS